MSFFHAGFDKHIVDLAKFDVLYLSQFTVEKQRFMW